ncbi:hypothetical protein DTO271G3_6784 [Paecilomyces variotii]|nr:hypothetical protein DTO271G3_6784 [Paecilomyces variotii]
MEIQGLESEEISTDIPRDYTYSTVDSYVLDILGFHDNRLRSQPNAVDNLQDCGSQMAALAAMRTIFPIFFRREFRRGPFVFCLTDLYPTNIFVDDDWHITCLIDLEWACSRPIEMIEPPYWLTDRGVDQIIPEEYDVFRKEFMSALVTEENLRLSSQSSKCGSRKESMPLLSDIMEYTWRSGTFWYSLALSSPTALFSLFYKQIQPIFSKHSPEDFSEVMPFYWDRDAAAFTVRKLTDKRKYDKELELAFHGNRVTE